jgi:hypothetical protein
MAKIALYFDIPDNEIERLIPAVMLHVEITTYGERQWTTYVTERSVSKYHSGTNAEIVVLSKD